MRIYRASPLPPLSTYLFDSLFGCGMRPALCARKGNARTAAAPGSETTLGVKQTIDNSAHSCHKGTIVISTFVDDWLTDI